MFLMLPSLSHLPALPASLHCDCVQCGQGKRKGSTIVQKGRSQQLWFRAKMRKLLNATKVS